jgi:transmembrane sensor
MNNNIPWELLAGYFAGELTREERKSMETWIKADPKREEQVKFLYKIWDESKNLPYQLNVDQAWERLEVNMDQFEESTKRIDPTDSGKKKKTRIVSFKKPHNRVKKTGGMGRHIAMIAVSVLIMLTAGFFAYQYNLGLKEAEEAAELAREVLTTKDGERAIYTLSDDSRVILHAGSRLEVPANFNTENRELFLEGEAYFEVIHDPDSPFIVHSGEAYTRVLGTKFLVQAWPDESRQVEVIVEEGKVALGETRPASSSVQQEVIISYHQKGVLASGVSPAVSDVTDLHWHLGWTEGRLVFEDRQLSDILPRLERWYAVDIHTEESAIDEMKLTAEIDYSQPMMEVLTGIALSLDLDIEKEDRTFTFRLAVGS